MPSFAMALEVHTTPSGKKFPLNSEVNRMELSRGFVAEGDDSMTPAMCGFALLGLGLDSDASVDARVVAGRIHNTYKDRGMQPYGALAAAMRIKAEQPALFREMAARN